MTEISDQEIDIRPYVEAILNKWYWILGLGVLAGVLAYAATLLESPTYEATALVAITEPRQKVQFDPRIQTVSDNQPVGAYPELALSDELLSSVITQLPDSYNLSLQELRAMLEARPGQDSRILRLTARNGDPNKAANVTNIWADIFVNWANQVYGDQGNEQLSFFEEQLTKAADKLEKTEQALIGFQAQNLSSILENELLALQQIQSDYLARQRQIDLLLQDIDSLLTQAESNNDPNQVTIDQLSSALLQVRALGGVANSAESTMPWQFQVTVADQSENDQTDRREIISNLRETLLAQSIRLEDRLSELEPQILSVQQQKQEANTEENRLGRDFEVAEETYMTLGRTVDEKRITSQDTNSGVKLASKTSVPESPTGSSNLFVVIGAGLLGATIAVVAIVLATWWHKQ